MKKIFIIHGWTYTLTGWDACIADLRSKGFDPVMFHVPGLTEPSDKIWTLNDYVAWLAEKLKAESDVNLVVHSNGGRIAILYASSHPEKIKKLVLIDSAGLVDKSAIAQLRCFVVVSIAKAGKYFTDSAFVRKIFYRITRARDYGRAEKNMKETMKNLIAIDLKETLKNIKVPTLIIWGKRDKATPVSDAYIMNKGIVGSKLSVINDAAHSPHITHPKEVSEMIAEFIG